MATLSSFPIPLTGQPVGDTLAFTVTCTERLTPTAEPTPVDLSGALAIDFGIWQSVTAVESSPALVSAELGSGITVTGADDNVINIVCQTTGIKAGAYFYRVVVQLDATNRLTFAKGQITFV